MNTLETYGKEIVALLVPFITWALNTFLKARVKLYLANPHTFTFLVQQPWLDEKGNQISPTQTVHTQSLMVWNAGKETATKLEWVFNWKPLCINVWPSRKFEEHEATDRRYIITFDSLAPNEFVSCELLSLNRELPALVTVRSDQCTAQTIPMHPQPQISILRKRVAVVLQFAGLALVVYALILLIQFLVLKTPLGR